MKKSLTFKIEPPKAGTVIINKNYKIVNMDSGGAKILGSSSIGKNILPFIREDFRRSFRRRVSNLLGGRTRESKMVISLQTGEGEFLARISAMALGEIVILHLVDYSILERVGDVFRIITSSIHNILEMVVITDVDGTILYVNPAFTRITGYTFEEAVGQNPRILKSGKHSQQFYKKLWDTILSGKIWHGEIVNKKKDGTLYYEEMTIVPVKDEQGKIKYFVALKYDVTEKKMLEERLQREKEYYKSIMEGSPDGIFIESLDGKILDLNETAAGMFGYRREELLGKSVNIIVPPELMRKTDTILELLKKKKRLVLEIFNKHKKGYLVPVEISMNLVNIGGEELLIIISRDLSRRSEAEIKHRAITEMTSDAIIMVDHRGHIEFWNPAASRIFGYSQEEVIGKSLQILIPPEYRDKTQKIFKRVLTPSVEGGFKKYEMMTVPALRKGGERFSLEISPSIFVINDRPHGLVMARDVSDRVRTEKEILKRNKELKMLYDLAVSVSTTLSKEDFFKNIYESLKKIISFDSLSISLVNKERDSFTVEFSIEQGKILPKRSYPLDPKKSLTGWVIYHKKPLYLSSPKEIPPAQVHVIGTPTASWLGVPLVYQNEALGALVVESFRSNTFTEDEIHTLETLATYLAAVLKNVELYEEIRETKEKMEGIINTSLVGIGLTDLEDNLLFVNNKFADMLGYKTRELIGKDVLSFATEEERNKLIEGTKRRRRGISDSYEAQFVRKDGKIIDVLINASPYRDVSGNIIGTIGVVLDITEKKRVEERILEEREKYKTMMENLLVGVIIIQDEKVIYANKVFESLLGYSQENVLGENFTKFVHPDMRNYLLENYKKRMMGLNVPESYIIKLMGNEGKSIWALIRAAVVEWEGRKADMVSLQDITSLKEIEETLISMANAFEEIKLAHTEDEVFNLAINYLSTLLGFSTVGIVRIEEDGNLIVKSKYLKSPLQISLDDKKSIVAWVARNNGPYYAPDVTKDSLYLKVSPNTRCEYATPIATKDRIYGVLNIETPQVDGISEDERMLADLMASHIAVALAGLEYQKKLERAKSLQELMLHIVSHDLKNPLAVLQGYIDLMREMPSEEFLDSMESAIKETVDIIEKAKLFSRLGSEKIEKEKKAINIGDMIKECMELIAKKYPSAKIINEVGDIKIEGYPLLKEVFVNLMDNAFKYGASEMHINAKVGDYTVELRFADNGPGIPEDKKEIIFEPFERISKGKGSGLGLAIVKMIVELHKGKIRVEDNKPQGSVFVLQLPKE